MSFAKIKNLYIAVNHVVAELGKDGEIQRRHELVENLMMALSAIDHGEFKPNLFDRAQIKLEVNAARIAELEREAARLDWIIDNGTTQGGGHGFNLNVFIPVDCEDLKTAIDSAIQAESLSAVVNEGQERGDYSQGERHE